MKTALNLAWLAFCSAMIVVGLGFIARVYWLLLTLGWGVL